MARYTIRKEGLGCLNLIVWDLLITVVFIYFAFKYYVKGIHPLVGLLLGIATSVILIILMNKRIIGTIIHVILGIIWGFLFYSIVNSFFNWSSSDKVWNIFFILVFCLGGIVLHLASHKELNDEEEIVFSTKSKRVKNDYSTENADPYSEENVNYKNPPNEFNPFAGCTTKEQVKIRYKQLMKTHWK